MDHTETSLHLIILFMAYSRSRSPALQTRRHRLSTQSDMSTSSTQPRSFGRSTPSVGETIDPDTESSATFTSTGSDVYTKEAITQICSRFEAALNKIAERIEVNSTASNMSGVHTAALFLPFNPTSDTARPEGYREPNEVPSVPSRYDYQSLMHHTMQTDSLGTSAEAVRNFRG